MGDAHQRHLRAQRDPEREAVGVALAKVRDLDAKLPDLSGAARTTAEEHRAEQVAVIDGWRARQLAKKAAKAAEKAKEERENEGISTA